jgi:hypothetical protein
VSDTQPAPTVPRAAGSCVRQPMHGLSRCIQRFHSTFFMSEALALTVAIRTQRFREASRPASRCEPCSRSPAAVGALHGAWLRQRERVLTHSTASTAKSVARISPVGSAPPA